MEKKVPAGRREQAFACERFFDIVNGFFDRCRGAWVIQTLGSQSCVTTDASNLAEIIART